VEKICIKNSFMICMLAKYYSVDRIMKNEMGGTCGTYGGQERCVHGFDGET
jgi:hypothetical protein